MGESLFLRHEPCDSCGSSDANGVYDDGHEYCFSCGRFKPADGEAVPGDQQKVVKALAGYKEFMEGRPRALSKRKLDEATSQFFDYRVVNLRGQAVHMAPYYDAKGRLAAFHVRGIDDEGNKTFKWLGGQNGEGVKMNRLMPFGWQRWRHRPGRKLVITEGELDTMSLAQVQDLKWPVVSIPTGANPATVRSYIGQHRDWICSFDEVVLMFDMDEPGQKAAVAAAEVIGPKAHIAELPRKDANEMLVAGEVKELVQAMWSAKRYHPSEIVRVSDVRELVLKGPEKGFSFPFQFMTDWSYGIRFGEIHAIGAGTGVGKTDVQTEIAIHCASHHQIPTALFFMEQQPRETVTRLAGKIANRRFHVPQSESNQWTHDELVTAVNKLEKLPLFLYDSFGINDWNTVAERIRFLRHAEGVRLFFIDHITAMSEWAEDTRAVLESMMAQMAGLVKELDSTFFIVSHLATPEQGRPHEEGGRVTIRQFKGSRAIGTYSHFMWGLERDQQDEDEDMRHTTTVRCLKDRYTGDGTGNTSYLRYNRETGRLFVPELAFDEPAEPDFSF